MTLTPEYLKSMGLPQIEGNIKVNGLEGWVTIIRDRWGCPHIDARSEHDVWFAQGFCHAQDRLWQMERTRRFARGTLAEILGEPLIRIDQYYRRLGIRRTAQRDWALLNQETRDMLQAFSDGLNAAVASMRELPPEFKVLELVPEAWSPADSIAVWKIIYFTQTVDYGIKLFRTALARKMGPETAAFLEPGYPEDGPVVCPPGSTGEGLADELAEMIALVNELAPISSPEVGSNNWVVDGQLSASGKPLLAGDPHAVIQTAPVWYMNHLKTPEWEMTGVNTPGVPGILLYGHNQHVGWVVTNAVADIADLFVERFDESYRKYLHRGVWHEAEIWHEEIPVKGRSQPVVEEIPVTIHGPLVSGGLLNPGVSLSWQWTGNRVVRTLECIRGMAKARNIDEFRESQRNWSGPSMNRVMADDSGNIAYQTLPDIPVRAHGGANAVPSPGWTGEYDWVKNIPFDELPYARNPERHFIATANNRVAPAGYKYHLNALTIPYRAARAETMLKSKKRFDIDDFKAIQGDRYSAPAAIMLGILKKMKSTKGTESALAMLGSWDCVLWPDSAPAALYGVLIRNLMTRLFTFTRGLTGVETSIARWQLCYLDRLLRQIRQNDRSLIKLNSDIKDKTWRQVILDSLQEAWHFLNKEQGSDPAKWSWGKLHQQTFIHNLGRTAPHDKTFNIPPVGPGGDGTVLFNSGGPQQGSFESTGGVSFRMIVDLADMNRSVWVLPPGQSGHPGSPHYSDGIQPWLNVEYFPMYWNWDDIQANQEGTLQLMPG